MGETGKVYSCVRTNGLTAEFVLSLFPFRGRSRRMDERHGVAVRTLDEGSQIGEESMYSLYKLIALAKGCAD